jgi:hypothetical protein
MNYFATEVLFFFHLLRIINLKKNTFGVSTVILSMIDCNSFYNSLDREILCFAVVYIKYDIKT